MSAPTFTLLGLSDAFLEYGVSQETLVDPQDSCPICTITYGDSEDKLIATECGHTYHLACLRTWLETDQGPWVTCPMCRTKFFQRPEIFDYDEDYDRDYDEEDETLRDPEGWGGLQAARSEIDSMRQTIFSNIESIWGNWMREDDFNCRATSLVGWEPMIVQVLTLCGVSRGETYTPCSAEEFIVVKAIALGLAGYAAAENRCSSDLKEIIQILQIYEDSAENCIIEEA